MDTEDYEMEVLDMDWLRTMLSKAESVYVISRGRAYKVNGPVIRVAGGLVTVGGVVDFGGNIDTSNVVIDVYVPDGTVSFVGFGVECMIDNKKNYLTAASAKGSKAVFESYENARVRVEIIQSLL